MQGTQSAAGRRELLFAGACRELNEGCARSQGWLLPEAESSQRCNRAELSLPGQQDLRGQVAGIQKGSGIGDRHEVTSC